MNENKKDAVCGYLEFLLLNYVEQFERHIDDPLIVQAMYDEAYSMLVDMEQTIAYDIEITQLKTMQKR